jgi:hypothetical protein
MQMIYEITAIVREDLITGFEEYMIGRHIPDVMATGAFEESTFARAEPGRYRISYRTTRESLDAYLREHAVRLRADVAETFPDGLELSREVWRIVQTFGR